MIDTFALCGKSTWEKILLPKLFKQTMVEFSFLVTNLTFQGSDSSLAEREELMPAWGPWLTGSPRSHIHLEISWHCLSLCPLLWQHSEQGLWQGGRVVAEPRHVAEAAGANEAWHTLWGHFAVIAAWLRWPLLQTLVFPLVWACLWWQSSPRGWASFDSLDMAGLGKGTGFTQKNYF